MVATLSKSVVLKKDTFLTARICLILGLFLPFLVGCDKRNKLGYIEEKIVIDSAAWMALSRMSEEEAARKYLGKVVHFKDLRYVGTRAKNEERKNACMIGYLPDSREEIHGLISAAFDSLEARNYDSAHLYDTLGAQAPTDYQRFGIGLPSIGVYYNYDDEMARWVEGWPHQVSPKVEKPFWIKGQVCGWCIDKKASSARNPVTVWKPGSLDCLISHPELEVTGLVFALSRPGRTGIYLEVRPLGLAYP